MKIQINPHFKTLNESYLFSEIAARVKQYTDANPGRQVIRLGIGDVTLPLSPCVVEAMQKAVAEMGKQETFRGYAPEYGYDFLREAVATYYRKFGVTLPADAVFVSDGAKSDVGNITDIFGDNPIVIPDPVYPVYLDSNLMAGRNISFLKANRENGFLPVPEDCPVKGSMIVYLCSPNNPTGAVYTYEQLTNWVNFALETGSLIIFDSAYEAYIRGSYPHTIYEIDGAESCAIEICSLSKTAGFTGTRCAWTIVPNRLESQGMKLQNLWKRRQATKFNGVPYAVQRAAQAALSEQGQRESAQSVAYYMENARILSAILQEKKIWFVGGKCSPYIWLQCPDKMDSWSFFDLLLTKFQIVGTPGAGFGPGGEGYFRLTSFGSREATEQAVQRLQCL